MLGRRAPAPGESTPARPPLRVLRADGRRIDLASPSTKAYLVGTQQAWQPRAFDYRDLIGELRYAVRLRAHAVAQARFYLAETRPWPQDPVPLDSEDCTLDAQLVADALANFADIPFDHNPDGFTARLDENLSLPGEAWIHIDAERRWSVRSISEIVTNASGKVSIATLPGGTVAGQRVIDPDVEELLRVWRPHPEWGDLADSPMRSLMDVAEDVVLAGREGRAAARSRLAGNGILFLSDGLTLHPVREAVEDELDGGEFESDQFMADLTAAMLAPVTDDADPQAVVPIVVRGNTEDIQTARHLTLQREESASLINRQTSALLRLLRGLDVQPEQVDGISGLNHWSAWAINTKSIKEQVIPGGETIAAALMQAFMRPALVDNLGHDPAQVSRIVMMVDASELAENPNRGQDARDGHEAGVLSDATLRRVLGFDDSDAPDDDERIKRLAANGQLPVAVTAALFGLSGQDLHTASVIQDQIGDAPASATPAALPAGSSSTPAAAPGQVTPTRPLPPAPAGITASAPPPILRLDVDGSRRLSDIDTALVERITVAGDAALHRVLERAGNRLRNLAARNGGDAVRRSLADVDADRVAATLGRARVEELASVSSLLEDGYARLRGQVGEWMTTAAAETAGAVVDLLGVAVDSPRGGQVHRTVLVRLGSAADRAWPVLLDALHDAAHEALFAADSATGPLLDTQDVVDALAVAGGDSLHAVTAAAAQDMTSPKRPPRTRRRTPGAGLATGPAVAEVISGQGGIVVGHEWRYRPGLPRLEFPPHRHLDGARFASWTDDLLDTRGIADWVGPFFHPQDHQGCRCAATWVYALPADPDSDEAAALRRAAGNPDRVAHGATHADLRARVQRAAADMRAEFFTDPRRRRRR